MLSKEELLKLSIPDPELTAHLASTTFPGVNWDDIPSIRAMSLAGAQRVEATLTPVPSDLHQSRLPTVARDGHELQHWLTKPASPPPSGSPLVILIHGGGFVMGHAVSQVPLARALAKLYGAVVVSLQYRLAPELPFPQQQCDVIDSVKWIATNAASLGADTSKGFVLGGSSAGGQLAAVTAQHLGDESFAPKLTGLYQNITIVLAEEIVPEKYRPYWISRTEDPNTADAVILNQKDAGVVNKYWKPDVRSPMYSPFNSPKAHQNMPQRTFFQVCGQDPLRDDSYVYEDALKEMGYETRLEIYPGLPHGFASLLPGLTQEKKWRADFAMGLGWLLGKTVTAEQLRALAG